MMHHAATIPDVAAQLGDAFVAWAGAAAVLVAFRPLGTVHPPRSRLQPVAVRSRVAHLRA